MFVFAEKVKEAGMYPRFVFAQGLRGLKPKDLASVKDGPVTVHRI